MYYLQLYPTPNNNYCHATYDGIDFANDKKVCISNVNNKCVDDITATTEELRSDEESSHKDEYILRSNNSSRPITPTMPTRNKLWQKIIQANNLHELPQSEAIFNTARITRSVKHAISDYGATGHFLVENAPVANK